MPCPVRAAAVFVAATVFGSVAVAGDQASTAARIPVVSRDAAGRVTLRAVRIDRAVQVDGQLDEPVYREVSPAGDFVQFEPVAGSPATEATDVWLLFDDDTIYVSARCWDSAPESRRVINAIPRDSSAIINNENFTVLFDTFYDRRNAYLFEITAGGALWDGQITNQRVPANQDWNAVWEGRVGRFDGGWTVEMAIPFRALRYPPGSDQVWGVNFRRIVRWKNEESLLTPIPAMTGSAIFQVSLAGTLTELEVPSGNRTFEVKPYGISGVSTEVAGFTASSRVRADVGVDAKYGVTQNLTADLTVNTDFAQVEADEQQVNLTRFSLFFPEKREFFLEGQGIFEFGGAGSQGRNTPLLFYSRRIGLEQGQVIPIVGGGRLTGKVGKTTVGLMDVYTDAEPRSGTRATNNAVMRVKRDILRRSSIGAIFTSRSASVRGPGASQTYGMDAAFGFRDNVLINTYFRSDPDAGDHGRRHQLPRAVRLHRRSLRPAGGAARGGRELQSGAGLCAPRRHPAECRVGAVQPASFLDRGRAAILTPRHVHRHQRPRRPPRHPFLRPAVRRGVRDQRPGHDRLPAAARSPGAELRDRARRHGADRAV